MDHDASSSGATRSLPGFLAAEIPGGYLVEFRVREGWDGAIPRAAVLIHRFESDGWFLMPGNLGRLGSDRR